LNQKAQATWITSCFQQVAEIPQRLIKLAAMDAPSVSILSTDILLVKTRRTGRGFWAKCR
jgi:hypothetical protein